MVENPNPYRPPDSTAIGEPTTRAEKPSVSPARRRAALFLVEMVIVLVAAGFGGLLCGTHPEVKISAIEAVPLGAMLVLSGPMLLGQWIEYLIATVLLALIASGYFYPSKVTRSLSIIALLIWLFFGVGVLGLYIT